MAVATLTPARALRQPRRLDARVLVGLGLAILGLAGSLAFWTTVADSRAVVVATRDLAPGTMLRAEDLALTRARLDEAVYAASVPGDELTTLVGMVLAQPVYAQQILARAQVTGRRPALGPDQMALTIPVVPETAAGGQVQPGDSVRVLATTNKGKPESQTHVVLERVTVYDVARGQNVAVVSTGAGADVGARQPRGPLSSVTLVVSPEQSLALARARWNGDLDVALLPPQR